MHSALNNGFKHNRAYFTNPFPTNITKYSVMEELIYPYACSTILHDFLEILKCLIQNFRKILVTDNIYWMMTVWTLHHDHPSTRVNK